MPKQRMRPMTVRGIRRFLERFPREARMGLIDPANPINDVLDLPYSTGEMLDQFSGAGEDDPVFLSSRLGVLGVWGFLLKQPTLVCGLPSASIESN